MEFTQSEKDSFLAKLNEIIEANLSNEHFGVFELAREMGMSRSNLHRKVKTIPNISVNQLIKEIRLK
jgi:AraC-like DNA-binding protein